MVTRLSLTGFFGLIGLMLYVSSGTGFAQISHSGRGYTFRLKAKLGETLNYRLTMRQEMSNSPQEFGMQATDMSMTIKETCVGIKGGQLTMKTVDSPYNMNGHTFGKSTVSEIKLKRDGEVVVNSFSGMPSMSLGNLYDHTLLVGKIYKIPAVIKSSNYARVKEIENESVKFIGFSRYKGIQAAKFQMFFKSRVTLKTKNAFTTVSQGNGTGIEWISLADGWPEYLKIISNSISENPVIKNSSYHASKMTMISILERE